MGGCNDCHTPMKFDPEIGMPVPDMTRMLSGHPEGAPDPTTSLSGHDAAAIGPTFTSFKAPFGIVYTANLTPDKETGLGNWTEDMFLKAVRTGRHMGGTGRPILPPMPWPNVGMQSDGTSRRSSPTSAASPPSTTTSPPPRFPTQAMDAIAASYDKMLAKMAKASWRRERPPRRSPDRALHPGAALMRAPSPQALGALRQVEVAVDLDGEAAAPARGRGGRRGTSAPAACAAGSAGSRGCP